MELGKKAIKNNKLCFPNNTLFFLTPMFMYYGDTFMGQLRKMGILCFGIDDYKFSEEIGKKEDVIFALCDSWIRNPTQEPFNRSLNYLKQTKAYVHHYALNDIEKPNRYIMVILKLPDRFKGKVDLFKEGKYSKLYTSRQANICFKGFEYTEQYKIVIRDKAYGEMFARSIIEEFNINYKIKEVTKEILSKEYNKPSKMELEIFNYLK